MTPLSVGAAIHQRQEGDMDQVEKYNQGDHNKYILEDLKNQIFVDFEVFMKHILHVPDDLEH